MSLVLSLMLMTFLPCKWQTSVPLPHGTDEEPRLRKVERHAAAHTATEWSISPGQTTLIPGAKTVVDHAQLLGWEPGAAASTLSWQAAPLPIGPWVTISSQFPLDNQLASFPRCFRLTQFPRTPEVLLPALCLGRGE